MQQLSHPTTIVLSIHSVPVVFDLDVTLAVARSDPYDEWHLESVEVDNDLPVHIDRADPAPLAVAIWQAAESLFNREYVNIAGELDQQALTA